MAGFGFGGFDLANLSDIGNRLQKLKEDVEQTIDASLRDEEDEGGTPPDDTTESQDGTMSSQPCRRAFFLFGRRFWM